MQCLEPSSIRRIRLRAAKGRTFESRCDSFYDDEKDTVTQTPWSFLQTEKKSQFRSVQEEAGFGEDGDDLAMVGLAPYLAFLPFLLFFFSYVFGDQSGSGPYSTGNF